MENLFYVVELLGSSESIFLAAGIFAAFALDGYTEDYLKELRKRQKISTVLEESQQETSFPFRGWDELLVSFLK